jgi:hypothetical protein
MIDIWALSLGLVLDSAALASSIKNKKLAIDFDIFSLSSLKLSHEKIYHSL